MHFPKQTRKVAEMVSEYFIPQTTISTKPRVEPMPHNGYRPFDPSVSLAAFPEFSYTRLAKGLEKTSMQLKSNI